MSTVEIKENTHFIIKRDDLKYLTDEEKFSLYSYLLKIKRGRIKDGKIGENSYSICNRDEPYHDLVLSIILEGELEKINGLYNPSEIDEPPGASLSREKIDLKLEYEQRLLSEFFLKDRNGGLVINGHKSFNEVLNLLETAMNAAYALGRNQSL